LADELVKGEATTRINDPADVSQLAYTSIQLAITNLLRSWELLPTSVAGHSIGEILAAYSAEILSLE
ncbi:hypothetical protein BJ878DRAFT_405782, partial [Calycina marina]